MTLRAGQRKVGVSAKVTDLFRLPGLIIPSAIVGSTTYEAAVLADAPILYLRLEETSGTNCADSSTSAFTGTVQGSITRNVASHAGLGVGVTHGGADGDYISVPDDPALDLTADFSYEMWIKYTDRTKGHMLMSKGTQDASNGGYVMYLSITSGNVNVDRGSLTALYRPGIALSNDGNWHHLVLTRATNTYKFYVDGSVIATSGTVSTAVQATNRAFAIGANFLSTGLIQAGAPMVGSIDEIAVYATALSAARVLAHYNAAV